MIDSTAPSFPRRRIPPKMDGFTVDKNIPTDWETTYSAGSKPKQISSDLYGRIEIDTSKLQSTHWTTGNEPTTMLTEHQEKYRPYDISQREPVRTRDQLMKSSFTLGDGFPMETRESLTKQNSTPYDPNRVRPGIHEELVGSHIDLRSGTNEKWETTNQASYKKFSTSQPSIANPNFQSGQGARDALSNDQYTNSYTTENQSNFIDFHVKQDPIDQQERLTRYRNSNVQLGDYGEGNYLTTNQADYKHFRVKPVDPKVAKAARERLTRSQFSEYKKEPMNTRTSYNDTFIEYKGFHPPSSVERSAFISHHDFRNCPDTFCSESHASYISHPISKTQKADLNLSNTHIVFGTPEPSDMRSLYQDTFKGIQTGNQRIDPTELRSFNTAHHMKVNDDTADPKLYTTNQVTYVHHNNFRPRSPIHFSKMDSVIAPSDPSLTVTESTMHASFVPHHNASTNKPINNSLQSSHINFSGGETGKWTTTQSDYFQFKTYKFD